MRPGIVVQVVGVFVAFMALAWFVFHSPEAVKTLAVAAAGAVVSLVPGVLSRVEYRLTAAGLEKRPYRTNERLEPKARTTAAEPQAPKPFEPVFAWDELSHVVPTGSGFKYYKRVKASNPFRRFLRRHVSAESSGEFHVEPGDRDRVRTVLEGRHVPTGKRLGA